MVVVVMVVVRVAVRPPARRCERSTAAPTATTSRPETRFSHGYSVSGSTYCESASVIAPSANTPAVCVTVTIAPSATACRGLAARADQVRGHHRLAVPRRERVHGAPAEGGEQQQQQHALARRGVAEDLRQPSSARSDGVPAIVRSPSGAVSVPAAGLGVQAGGAHVRAGSVSRSAG